MTLIQISNRLKVNYQNTISQTLFPHPFFFIIFSFLFFLVYLCWKSLMLQTTRQTMMIIMKAKKKATLSNEKVCT